MKVKTKNKSVYSAHSSNIEKEKNQQLSQKIEQLQTSLSKLQSQLDEQKVQAQNCSVCALWDEVDQLKEQVISLKDENLRLNHELETYVDMEEKSKKRLYEADKKADELYKTSQYQYLSELKVIKLLIDKSKDFCVGSVDEEKQSIIDLLTDFLQNSDSQNLITAKLVANKVLGKPQESLEKAGEEVEQIFDLEEAINPSYPLDLKTLLGELGIKGEEN